MRKRYILDRIGSPNEDGPEIKLSVDSMNWTIDHSKPQELLSNFLLFSAPQACSFKNLNWRLDSEMDLYPGSKYIFGKNYSVNQNFC